MASLFQMVFKSCGADQCLYVKLSKKGHIYVCLYVDDILIAAKRAEICERCSHECFQMKENGDANFIVRMEIDYDKKAGTFMIRQTRSVDDVDDVRNDLVSRTPRRPIAHVPPISSLLKSNRQEQMEKLLNCNQSHIALSLAVSCT